MEEHEEWRPVAFVASNTNIGTKFVQLELWSDQSSCNTMFDTNIDFWCASWVVDVSQTVGERLFV